MAANEGKLVALLLGMAGVGALICRAVIGRRLAEERRNLAPVDPDVVAAEFEGIPLYPGAELDRAATAGMRWTATHIERWMRPLIWAVDRLPGPQMADVYKGVPAVYMVEAPAAKVLAWYHKTLKAAGWKYREMPDRDTKRGGYRCQVYKRRDTTLSVLARPAETGGLTRVDVVLTAG